MHADDDDITQVGSAGQSKETKLRADGATAQTRSGGARFRERRLGYASAALVPRSRTGVWTSSLRIPPCHAGDDPGLAKRGHRGHSARKAAA